MIQISIATTQQSKVSVYSLLDGAALTTSGESFKSDSAVANFLAAGEHQGKFGVMRSVYLDEDALYLLALAKPKNLPYTSFVH